MGSPVKSHDPLYAAVGAYLRGKRLEHEIRQAAMARRLGLTAAQVAYYEKGTVRIPLLTFCRWCHLLNLDPGDTLNLVYGTMQRQAVS